MTCLAMLALLPAQAIAVPHTSGAWLCTFTEELRCDPGRGCLPADAGTTTTLYEMGGLYLNCTPSMCIPGIANFHVQGELLTAHVPEFGAVVNLSPNLEVTEVSTIGHLVFIRRGRCTEGPPPILDQPSR
jgi:hypothetical protein